MENTIDPINKRHNSWVTIILLNFFGWIFIYADRTILNPVMPAIQSEFGLNHSQLGLISSLFFLTYTIVQMPFSTLADYFSKKWIIGLGFIFFGVMTLFSGLVTTIGLFLITRAMVGIGEGSFYGASYGLSSQVLPKNKLTFGTALINSGQAFGQILGTLLSSILVLQLHFHWSTPFITISVPTVIVGLLYILVIRDKPFNASTKPNHSKTAIKSIDIKALFTRNLSCTYLMLFASIYGQIVMITWLPLYLIDYRHISGTNVGWVASIVPFIAIPSALLFARINDYLKNTKTLICILVPLSAISLIVGVTINNDMVLLLSLLVYGVTGKMALDPLLLYTIKINAKNSQLAMTFGIYNFLGMIASIIAPIMTGFLIDVTKGMSISFYVAALLLMASLVCFIFVKYEAERD
ncbi:MFS transporter [Leuconostoc mesenteroides]|uniref:MFS transporter n=1 Tax=Leuconostoc mesenteroides TaxID=1245 RepID=UPI0011A87343|nr:MFS transporter [Leuconostoc mesenteroides]